MADFIYDQTRSPRTYRISEALTATYTVPARDPLPLGNKPDPLDELIYITLTVMTEFGVDGVWAELKRRYPTWDALLRGRRNTLIRILQPIGLYEQKADRIREILRRIKADRGACSLSFLRDLSDEDAERYLTSLPGVGKKVARCVLMYSLGRDVLPVDAHVLRVSRRVGLLPDDIGWDRAHDAIHEAIPAQERFAMHVNLVRHGREVCRARNPQCEVCTLRAADLCLASR